MSKIKITAKGNVKVDGVKYVARRAESGCRGCAFDGVPTSCQLAPCMCFDRKPEYHYPHTSVIFIEKERT